jgi:hypothetical protein
LAVLLAAPVTGWVAVVAWEKGRRLVKEIRAYLLLRSRPERHERLRRAREEVRGPCFREQLLGAHVISLREFEVAHADSLAAVGTAGEEKGGKKDRDEESGGWFHMRTIIKNWELGIGKTP